MGHNFPLLQGIWSETITWGPAIILVGVHGDRHYVPCMKKSDILIWPTVVWEDRILHTYTYMAIGASCFDYTIENDLSVSSEVQQWESFTSWAATWCMWICLSNIFKNPFKISFSRLWEILDCKVFWMTWNMIQRHPDRTRVLPVILSHRCHLGFPTVSGFYCCKNYCQKSSSS